MRSLNPIRPGNLSPLILRNSECDACGCGGDRVDRYMRKTSKNSRVEFGYNSPKPNRCLYLSLSLCLSVCPTVRCPLGFVCALPAFQSSYTDSLPNNLSVFQSFLPAFHFPCPFRSVFFSTLSLRQIKFKQSHKSWQIPLLIPIQVNKAKGRF